MNTTDADHEPSQNAWPGAFLQATEAEENGETTTFTTAYREVKNVWSGQGSELRQYIHVVDNRGKEAWFDREEDFAEFTQLDVGIEEFFRYQQCDNLSKIIETRLPAGELSHAVSTALQTVARKQLEYIRERKLQGGISEEEENNLLRSQRDVEFALAGIAKALDLYSEPGAMATDEPYGTHAWYENGRKNRHGGYIAKYAVCSDEIDYDDDDHAAELGTIRQDDELDQSMWPDQFHYPGKLEIRVDPKKRIEFVYTPEIDSARKRHASRSEVHSDGKIKQYENESLSIRLDLDPTAPHGIALDVGRSPFEGEKNGKKMVRSGDLVGSVLEQASDSASHEYTGFTNGMASQFENYAERFAVWLNLQHKEYLDTVKQQKLATGALKVAERFVA